MKPPSGMGWAAVGADQEASDDAPSDAPRATAVSTDSQHSHDSIEDAIGDILLEVNENPAPGSLSPLTFPESPSVDASIETPEPIGIETPEPVAALPASGEPVSAQPPSAEPPSMKTPEPEAVSLLVKTPPPVTKTPGPLSIKTPTPIPEPLLADASSALDPAAAVKTPPPLTERDPSSALPSIPPAKKEPSGAFPLPGMAPEAAKSPDEDATLIARLSLLDDVGDESTKVEPLETALRAAASKEEPIALSDQALVERGKALGVPAEARIAAAAFEVPEKDDELTVSATPGIISISDDDDEDETTASQRPQGARKTPTPTTVGPHLQTPQPLLGGGPRLPTPVPPFGRTSHLPAPGSDFLPVPTPLVSPASGPNRSLTPALPISAPQGFPTSVGAARSAIFNKVQLPLGGLVAFFVAMFGLGLLFGAWLWRGQGPITAEAPASTPTPPSAVSVPLPSTVPPPAVAAEPSPAVAAPKEPKPAEPGPAPAPEKAGAVEPVHAAHAPVAEAPPVRRVAAARPKVAIRRPAAGGTASTAGPSAAAPKPPAKPAASAAVNPTAKPLTASASKPASKSPPAPDKPKSKAWVDPFAE